MGYLYLYSLGDGSDAATGYQSTVATFYMSYKNTILRFRMIPSSNLYLDVMCSVEQRSACVGLLYYMYWHLLKQQTIHVRDFVKLYAMQLRRLFAHIANKSR